MTPAGVKGVRPTGLRFDAEPLTGAKPFGEAEPVAGPIVNPTGVRGLLGLGPDVPVDNVAYPEGFVRTPGLRPGSFPNPSLGTVNESNTLNTSMGPLEFVPVLVRVAFCKGPTVGPA